MPGDCILNIAWMRDEGYSNWLIQDKIKPASNARCRICLKTFDVRNIGESAVKNHVNGKKHVLYS